MINFKIGLKIQILCRYVGQGLAGSHVSPDILLLLPGAPSTTGSCLTSSDRTSALSRRFYHRKSVTGVSVTVPQKCRKDLSRVSIKYW